jgi:GxxExxY protein
MTSLKRQDLVFPELSFKIIGCAYEVFNALGYGHAEKYYQRALALEFKRNNLKFTEQVYTPLRFKGEVIGRLYLDFLVDDKIIVEIKKTGSFSIRNIDQVHEYLLSTGLHLAIIINFTATGIVSKRVVNTKRDHYRSVG